MEAQAKSAAVSKPEYLSLTFTNHGCIESQGF